MPAYWIRASIEGQNIGAGNLVVNTLHYEVDTLTSPPDLNSIAGDLWTRFGTEYLGVMSTLDRVNQLKVVIENYPNAVPGEGVHTVALPGNRSITSGTLPYAMCLLVQEKTQTPKRYGRGHMFLPPALDNSTLASGAVWNQSNTYFTQAGLFIGKAMQPFSAGSTGYVPIVFSRTRAKLGLTPFVFPITAATLSVQPRWLRSRLSSP